MFIIETNHFNNITIKSTMQNNLDYNLLATQINFLTLYFPQCKSHTQSLISFEIRESVQFLVGKINIKKKLCYFDNCRSLNSCWYDMFYVYEWSCPMSYIYNL